MKGTGLIDCQLGLLAQTATKIEELQLHPQARCEKLLLSISRRPSHMRGRIGDLGQRSKELIGGLPSLLPL